MDSNDDEPRTHYHYSISLRMRHPSLAPERITEAMGIQPSNSWKAGEARRTPKGTLLTGIASHTFWIAPVTSGRWPMDINKAVLDVLKKLVRHRSFLHQIRADDGSVELFIGWFFENQSGDVLTHQCLALAGDLQIDLSFDVYPPDQPQNEYEIENPLMG